MSDSPESDQDLYFQEQNQSFYKQDKGQEKSNRIYLSRDTIESNDVKIKYKKKAKKQQIEL